MYSQLEIVSVGVKSKNLERHRLHFQNFKYILETESYNYIFIYYIFLIIYDRVKFLSLNLSFVKYRMWNLPMCDTCTDYYGP